MSRMLVRFLLPIVAILTILPLPAQNRSAGGAQAILLSDIHLDPFLDPDKAPQLAAAPVSAWRAILDAPPSPDRDLHLAALEKSCHTRGRDTSEALFVSSLQQIHSQGAHARFALLAGDLLAHAFDCKFDAVFPKAPDGAYRAFTVKTMEYILLQIRAALPGVPLYPALGNNDSGCGDYQLDPHSAFLAESAPAFVADLPVAEHTAALADFDAFGDYSVALPAPFHHLRLIALDDLFESRRYAGCDAQPNPAAASQQLAWLTAQLQSARSHGEKLWIVGHIPPGIDPYSTATHLRNVCAGKSPEMYLSSGALPEAIAAFPNQVPLAIFAHSHMDEMRLIPAAGGNAGIAVKMIPSISPINGNLPSFTLAQIDPQTGILLDYTVIASSDPQGSAWAPKYRFQEAYHQPAYTAATVGRLLAGFQADRTARNPTSQTYIDNYYFRSKDLLMSLYWPQYACSLANMDAASYRSCLCPAAQ